MNSQAAEDVFRELHESYTRIHACISEVFEHASYAQSIEFRNLAGQIMGGIVLDFFNPIIAEHPQLEPEDFKTTKPYRRHPLPEPVAQSILSAVSELEARVQRLATERFASLPPDESAHYQHSSDGLLSSVALARDFVARATRQ